LRCGRISRIGRTVVIRRRFLTWAPADATSRPSAGPASSGR